MRKQKDTPESLLKSVHRLARRALRECETARFVEGANMWMFALFAKQIHSVASVGMLVAGRQLSDAVLIIRSMCDALFQIAFILNTSHRRSEIEELLKIEAAVDLYDELKFIALVRRMSVQKLVATDARARERADEYKRATRHPAFNERRQWPKRLRYLSMDELKATIKHIWNPELEYLVTSQGNSVAHSRFAALTHFVRDDKDGNIRVSMRPQTPPTHEPEVVRMCAFLCVLITTDMIVDRFGFGAPFSTSVRRLHKRWLTMATSARGPNRRDTHA